MEGVTQQLDRLLTDVRREVINARAKHPNMTSLHEAFGVIYEEFVIEFAAEMAKNPKKMTVPEQQQWIHNTKLELIQTAAMAIRAIMDVVEGNQQ